MATKFDVTVKSTGGDYTGIVAAEAGLQNNLTAADIKVFSISETSAGANKLAAGTSVHGGTSGATAVVVLVNASDTQILLKTVSGTFQNAENVHKTDDTNKYVVLSNTGDSPIISITCFAMTDTGNCDWNGWTTGASNYVEIQMDSTARHAGVYDDGGTKYLHVSNSTASSILHALYPSCAHFRLDGEQYHMNHASSVRFVDPYNGTGTSGDVRISNTLGKYSSLQTGHGGIIKDTASVTPMKIWNNIFLAAADISGNTAINIAAGSDYHCVYNNTIAAAYATDSKLWGNGIKRFWSVVVCKNNIVVATDDGKCFVGVDASSDYNVSGDATAPGAHSKINSLPTFVKYPSTAADVHLASGDTIAKDSGTDLSADAGLAFNTDIDGGTRSGSWDIGADEYGAVAGTGHPAMARWGGVPYMTLGRRKW